MRADIASSMYLRWEIPCAAAFIASDAQSSVGKSIYLRLNVTACFLLFVLDKRKRRSLSRAALRAGALGEVRPRDLERERFGLFGLGLRSVQRGLEARLKRLDFRRERRRDGFDLLRGEIVARTIREIADKANFVDRVRDALLPKLHEFRGLVARLRVRLAFCLRHENTYLFATGGIARSQYYRNSRQKARAYSQISPIFRVRSRTSKRFTSSPRARDSRNWLGFVTLYLREPVKASRSKS